MPLLSLIANFFAGAFLVNAIPHLTAGVRGESFPTPFSKPPGLAVSSPVTNVAWGTFNLVFGLVLLARNPVEPGFNLPFAVFLLSFLLLGMWTAHHFAKARIERIQRGLPESA